eukprot:455786-Pelagomonas_calceolata.AAC.1
MASSFFLSLIDDPKQVTSISYICLEVSLFCLEVFSRVSTASSSDFKPPAPFVLPGCRPCADRTRRCGRSKDWPHHCHPVRVLTPPVRQQEHHGVLDAQEPAAACAVIHVCPAAGHAHPQGESSCWASDEVSIEASNKASGWAGMEGSG